LRFAEQPARQIVGAGAVGFDLDAGILRLEHVGNIAVRREARIPHHLAFFFRACLEHLLSIRAAIVGKIGDRFRLRLCEGREQNYDTNNQKQGSRRRGLPRISFVNPTLHYSITPTLAYSNTPSRLCAAIVAWS
jgi:hypothetical protein